MRIVLLVSAAILAGCATPQYHQDRAAQATPVQLCEAYFYGPPDVQRAAAHERYNRGLDCNALRHEASLMYQQRGQRNATSDAALQNYLQSLQRQRPPPTFAPTTTCRTVRMGDTLQTHCF